MKSKKGISPLIATVLVIGFTIVLAALVMQWGGSLFKEMQEETGKTSDFKMVCSSKLTGLEVNANQAGWEVTVTLDNKNDFDIEGFIVRAYSGEEVETFDTRIQGEVEITDNRADFVVPAYGVRSFMINVNDQNLEQIGVFPNIVLNDEVKTCENEWKASLE